MRRSEGGRTKRPYTHAPSGRPVFYKLSESYEYLDSSIFHNFPGSGCDELTDFNGSSFPNIRLVNEAHGKFFEAYFIETAEGQKIFLRGWAIKYRFVLGCCLNFVKNLAVEFRKSRLLIETNVPHSVERSIIVDEPAFGEFLECANNSPHATSLAATL